MRLQESFSHVRTILWRHKMTEKTFGADIYTQKVNGSQRICSWFWVHEFVLYVVCLTHKSTTQYLEKLVIYFVSGCVTPVLMYDFPLFTTHLLSNTCSTFISHRRLLLQPLTNRTKIRRAAFNSRRQTRLLYIFYFGPWLRLIFFFPQIVSSVLRNVFFSLPKFWMNHLKYHSFSFAAIYSFSDLWKWFYFLPTLGHFWNNDHRRHD